MITKIIALFLLGMAVLAMFGRLRFPAIRRGKDKPKAKVTARKCPDCGAYMIGRGPCACKAPPETKG